MSEPDEKSGLELAVEAVGGQAKTLAERLGVSPQAISQWKQIPSDRVIAVERITGVHRRFLRPDLHPPELPASELTAGASV
jgi:DNA-binding transcriptional regulator YdaS (Cro superfamily)